MARLDEVSLDELQAQFGEANKKKPAERVLAAIAYKQDGRVAKPFKVWRRTERPVISNRIKITCTECTES